MSARKGHVIDPVVNHGKWYKTKQSSKRQKLTQMHLPVPSLLLHLHGRPSLNQKSPRFPMRQIGYKPMEERDKGGGGRRAWKMFILCVGRNKNVFATKPNFDFCSY